MRQPERDGGGCQLPRAPASRGTRDGPGCVPRRVELPAPAVALSGPSVGRPPPRRPMMAELGDRRRRRTAQQLLGGCEVATEAVATQVGSRPMRPTLPAELSRWLVDAAVVAATDMSVPVTVVIVDESGRAQRAVPHGRR